MPHDPIPPDIELSLSTEQACYIIVKAREFDVKEAPSGLTVGSNPGDDGMASVLEMRANDPVFAELRDYINDLNDDQQIDLVALAWVGRGDFDMAEWPEARAAAADAHNERTAEYLLGMPLLADFLEEGLAAAGRSCEDEEIGRL
jgi:hypothetical protein